MKLDLSPASTTPRRRLRPTSVAAPREMDPDTESEGPSATLNGVMRPSLSLLTSILLHCGIVILLGVITWGNSSNGSAPGELVELGVLPSELLNNPQFSTEQFERPGQPEEDLRAAEIEPPEAPFSDAEQLQPITLKALSAPNAPATGGGGPIGFGTGGGSGGGGQASFMGVQAYGRRFCIIADRSGSMSGRPLAHVKEEVRKTLETMTFGSYVHLVFYSNSWDAFPKSWAKPKSIRDDADIWLSGVRSRGGTNPAPAFDHAFDLTPPPDAIFFMTDGKIPANMHTYVRNLNSTRKKKIPVHTIAFLNRAAAPLLEQIATESGGRFRYVAGF